MTIKQLHSSDGNEPYVFISYRHADTERLLPILQALQEQKCRFWCDNGIESGATWSDYIADKIEKSACFLGFISRAYNESENCKNELTYVLDNFDKSRQTVLLVHLEEAPLAGGLAMRTNQIQGVIGYQKDRQTGKETLRPHAELVKELLAIPAIERCKEDSTTKDSYEGDSQNGQCHGKGTYRYANGNVYKGEWRYGKYDGEGKLTFANGDEYEGSFFDGKYHGKGTCRYANGTVYEGEWQEGQWHGEGVCVRADGTKEKGHFEGGEKNGFVRVDYTDGSFFEGEYRENKRHGQGTLSNPVLLQGQTSYNVEEGRWTNDEAPTYGVFRTHNGNVYEGEWKDALPHGRGTFRFQNGSRYFGDFDEGERSGHGVFRAANGAVYDGEWKSDRMHGKGKYCYGDGSVYEGDF